MMLILETDMILKILKHLQKSSQNDANNYDRFYQKWESRKEYECDLEKMMLEIFHIIIIIMLSFTWVEENSSH